MKATSGLNEKQIAEATQWAIATLQTLQAKQPHASREGTAALNRELLSRLKPFVPKEFIDLLARQLNVDGQVRNRTRKPIKQYDIAAALARNPKLNATKLERMFGVPRLTIGKWKKDPHFNNLVGMFQTFAETARMLAARRLLPDSPPPPDELTIEIFELPTPAPRLQKEKRP